MMPGCFMIHTFWIICSSLHSHLDLHDAQCACMKIPHIHLDCISKLYSETGSNPTNDALRASVERLFGDIANYFKFVDYKKDLKIRLSSVGKMYIAESNSVGGSTAIPLAFSSSAILSYISS